MRGGGRLFEDVSEIDRAMMRGGVSRFWVSTRRSFSCPHLRERAVAGDQIIELLGVDCFKPVSPRYSPLSPASLVEFLHAQREMVSMSVCGVTQARELMCGTSADLDSGDQHSIDTDDTCGQGRVGRPGLA